jgi:hypothetical protein
LAHISTLILVYCSSWTSCTRKKPMSNNVFKSLATFRYKELNTPVCFSDTNILSIHWYFLFGFECNKYVETQMN